MKARRAYTLVELLVTLALLAVVGLIAGRLVTGAFRTWQAEAVSAVEGSAASHVADALAADLAARVDLDVLSPDLGATYLLDGAGESFSFFIVGADAAVHAVAYTLVDDPALPHEVHALWRLEADALSTRAALPGNAALLALGHALERDEDTDVRTRLAAAGALRQPGQYLSVAVDATARPAATIQLRWLAPEGLQQLIEGRPLAALEDRLHRHYTAPVASRRGTAHASVPARP